MRVRLSVLLLLRKVIRLLSRWRRLLRLESLATLQPLALDLVGCAPAAPVWSADDDGSVSEAHPVADRLMPRPSRRGDRQRPRTPPPSRRDNVRSVDRCGLRPTGSAIGRDFSGQRQGGMASISPHMGHPAKLRPPFGLILLHRFGAPGRDVEYLRRRRRTISIPPATS